MNDKQRDYLNIILRDIKQIVDAPDLTTEEKISLLGLIL